MKLMRIPFLIAKSIVLPTVFLTLGCSSQPAYRQHLSTLTAPPSSQASVARAIGSSKPAMVLEAFPRQGFAPLSVTLHATLNGVAQNDPNFTCLYQEWEFGDGGISGEKLNCPTSQATSRVDTEFVTEHVFTKSGTYLIRFKLGDQMVTKRIAVMVYDRF